MTLSEAKLSLQVEAEARTGWLTRQRAYEAKAREDAAFDALKGAF